MNSPIDHSENQRTASIPPPRTILQIIPRLEAGGAERTTLDIAKALIAAGHRALVVSEGGRLEHELSAEGATLIRLPAASKNPLTILRNAGRLSGIIREQAVALIHARSRAPAWSALLAARRTGIPFVTTHHGTYNARSALKRLYNSAMVRADAVIANSAWTAEHLSRAHSIVPKRIAIVPRGIDIRIFNPQRIPERDIKALRENWGASDEARIILLPGRLTRWKGQLVMIDALSYLAREGKLPADVQLVLAGDSQGRRAYVDEIAAACAKAGLAQRVKIVGHLREMPPVYAAADIVVSASVEPEAFGRVPVEAAAMGKPVIATDHGGARETVLPGESGILVRPGDAQALGDALAALLVLPREKLAEMGAQGRAHVEARYTLEGMCTKTLALYDDLLKVARKS